MPPREHDAGVLNLDDELVLAKEEYSNYEEFSDEEVAEEDVDRFDLVAVREVMFADPAPYVRAGLSSRGTRFTNLCAIGKFTPAVSQGLYLNASRRKNA
jgi:hypothetical protein